MHRPGIAETIAWAAAVVLCLFIVRADLRTDDSGILAGVITLSACVLAIIRPAHAWRWGVLMGVTILIAELYGRYASPARPGPAGATALLPVAAFVTVIGMIGAYAGVGLRKLASAVFG